MPGDIPGHNSNARSHSRSQQQCQVTSQATTKMPSQTPHQYCHTSMAQLSVAYCGSTSVGTMYRILFNKHLAANLYAFSVQPCCHTGRATLPGHSLTRKPPPMFLFNRLLTKYIVLPNSLTKLIEPRTPEAPPVLASSISFNIHSKSWRRSFHLHEHPASTTCHSAQIECLCDTRRVTCRCSPSRIH